MLTSIRVGIQFNFKIHLLIWIECLFELGAFTCESNPQVSHCVNMAIYIQKYIQVNEGQIMTVLKWVEGWRNGQLAGTCGG
jgi:hypothetical protein